jgi:hypothetical protein
MQPFKPEPMKKVAVLLVYVILLHTAKAQNHTANSYSYSTALGVKVWDGAGISLKLLGHNDRAGEFIGYFYRYGFRLTGLYEFNHNISDVRGLKWYIGPGAHLGFYNDHYAFRGTYIGIDGVIGLDYKFGNAPINMSIDWQPAFEFGDGLGFNGSWGGLGIRYTF